MNCLICNSTTSHKDDEYRQASPEGFLKLSEVLIKRESAYDIKYSASFDRIKQAISSQDTNSIHWHRRCYSDFTNSTEINRLLKVVLKRSRSLSLPSCSKSEDQSSSRDSPIPPDTVKRCRSSGVSTFNKDKCMFCRSEKNEKLINVETKSMSESILSDSKFHQLLSTRLCDIIDLIAAKAKYHLKCLVYFRREAAKNKKVTANNSDGNAFAWLLSELRYAAKCNHILSMKNVWTRYLELCLEADVSEEITYSRRNNFYRKIVSETSDFYTCVRSVKEKLPKDRDRLLIPRFRQVQGDVDILEQIDSVSHLTINPPDSDLVQMTHVASRIRADILAVPPRRSLEVNDEEVMKCIPESLHMFLELVLGGCSEENSVESEENTENTPGHNNKIVNLAQDIVYNVRNGKVWTPKHVGLASALHQATRSKHLVNLFHSAGNVVSYRDVLIIDSSLAKEALQHYDPTTGAIIPQNLTHGTFVHYSADNIDLNIGSIDIKQTFHATQMAVWQRGPPQQDVLSNISICKTASKLDVPDEIGNLLQVNVNPSVNPKFLLPVEPHWFEPNTWNACPEIARAQAKDMAFIFHRQSDLSLGWTAHNEAQSTVDPPVTTIGYLPIIQAPAHDYDTLNTVVRRCMAISSHLGQKHTVITVDQALYYKLMILKWNIPEFQEILIPRLGGLHISMNFLKAIGQHTNGSGLEQIWIESEMLGENSVKMALDGKHYNRAIRAHKITLQAMWSILLPKFISFLEETNQVIHNELTPLTSHDHSDFLQITLTPQFQEAMNQFRASFENNLNISFWMQYIDMVSVLLMFTRSERDGIWDLYVHSFTAMIPWFMRYDHLNYAKWGPIYVAEMKQLPKEVLDEFRAGNFVVKGSERRFNQVDPDHSLEWINGVGKENGGLIGITQNTAALCKWSLSFNLKSLISEKTKVLLMAGGNRGITHNECTKSRIAYDEQAEAKVTSILTAKKVLDVVDVSNLQNPVTKDLASAAIEDSLLNAQSKGAEQLLEFVSTRLCPADTVRFNEKMTKNKALTMASLYHNQKRASKDKKEIIKVDRDVLHRILTAYKAGREVDLKTILKHELLNVPISLFEMNGNLRSGSKALLAQELRRDVICLPAVQLVGSSCLIVDGQALVMSIGKPQSAQTFGDVADVFVRALKKLGAKYDQTHIIFDRYIEDSIKSGTREKRSTDTVPTRRVISDRNVPVPHKWSDFMALPKNKEDLSRFLGEEILLQMPSDSNVIVSGAFEDCEDVRSKQPIDLEALKKWHEEGDTRLILHAIVTEHDNVVVMANDTDVLVLLAAHFKKMKAAHVWLMTGTSAKRSYVPIADIVQKLPIDAIDKLLQFHAITGCDTTSFIFNHSKKSAFKSFLTHNELLTGLGEGDLTEEKIACAESFVCKIYKLPDHIKTVDDGRYQLFAKTTNPENMPPTSNALRYHIQRCHYQATIWKNITNPEIHKHLSPQDFGWVRSETGITPITMSLDAIPEGCKEIISCGCKLGCRTMRCSCKKARLLCTDACKCFDQEQNCSNVGNTDFYDEDV